MEITLTVNKDAVMAEVAQRTAYIGAKRTGDEGAFERIPTVDEDRPELDQFWDESRAALTLALAKYFGSDAMNGMDYELVLNLSDDFCAALQPNMQLALFSYFVYNIIYRWLYYVNKDKTDLEYYLAQSDLQLNTLTEYAGMGGRILTRKMHPF